MTNANGQTGRKREVAGARGIGKQPRGGINDILTLFNWQSLECVLCWVTWPVEKLFLINSAALPNKPSLLCHSALLCNLWAFLLQARGCWAGRERAKQPLVSIFSPLLNVPCRNGNMLPRGEGASIYPVTVLAYLLSVASISVLTTTSWCTHKKGFFCVRLWIRGEAENK